MVSVQTVAQMVDFYMDDAHTAERKEIVRLASAERMTTHERNLLLWYTVHAGGAA